VGPSLFTVDELLPYSKFEMSVDELSVDELSVDELSVDELSPHQTMPERPARGKHASLLQTLVKYGHKKVL